MKSVSDGNYPVIEFRRYTIKDGEREHFAQRFESYFPEAIQQSGAIVAGQFFERENETMFTWIRGFHDMDDRGRLNAALYFGPVWKEHRSAMNELLIDSDNALLLHPVDPQRGVPVLRAVDPVTECPGAQGLVIAQIFSPKPDEIKSFLKQVEPIFAGYREAGAREAGVLITLNASNNFPQLPVRNDGPYVVWLGILRDNAAFEQGVSPLMERGAKTLSGTNLLRGTPETIVLEPAKRSRMRWLPEWSEAR